MAQLPAKLIKLFQWNVERNSHTAGMVPGITWKEWPQNERNRIDDAQIERRQMPTLDLGIVNPSIPSSSTTTTITDDAHPPSHPRHRHLITTITSSSPSSMAASHHIYCPRPAQQGCHVTNQMSARRIDDGMGDSGCHIAGCDVASTQRTMTMSSFVVVVSICTQCGLLIPLCPN